MESLALFFGCFLMVLIVVSGGLLLGKVVGFNNLPSDDDEVAAECDAERSSEVKLPQ